MFTPGEKVVVALSGGPDSTALLIMLREQGHEVVAAHYDHALQPASAQMAQHVARLCDQMGVELISERRTTPLAKGSLQAAARDLRYEFLERAAARGGATAIALGHTADDLVEGMVMHLLRGSGIAGLRGMPTRRGLFVRPLLGLWRADIEAFLADRHVTALEDPANSNERFERVMVRRSVLPALERSLPGITRRLHRVALRAADMQARIEDLAADAIADGSIPASTLRAMPEPVAVEALQGLYVRAGGKRPALVRRHFEAMLRLATGGPGGRGVDLPGGLRFRVVESLAEIRPRVIPSMEAKLQVRTCAGCDQREAAHLRRGLQLHLGFRRPGLRMRPARSGGTRKLQDIFVDAKVPREERDSWPLVFAGEQLAWVPGIAIDSGLESPPGEPALHVTVTRILAGRKDVEEPMLESPDSPRGESS